MRCKAGFSAILLVFALAAAPSPKTAADYPRIELSCGEVSVTYTDYPIEPTNHIVADEIAERKINGSLYEKAEQMDNCLSSGSTYQYAVLYAFPRLKAAADELISGISRPAENSAIAFNPDRRPMFYITREKAGRTADPEALYKSVYFSVKKACYRNESVISTQVSSDEVPPEITAEDNVLLTKLRARFTTDMSCSGENRKHNIRLAFSKINGTVLAPGEIFSFNSKVGRRTKENGFLEANIILDGEYVSGYGGGVCQASTTLYNCALTAGMKVTAVRNHSLAASYVPPSFDAMVNSGSSDLQFVNEGDTPVFIRCVCSTSTVTAEIYGAPLPYRIERESVVVRRIPAPEDTVTVDSERKYTSGLPSGEQVRVSYGKDGIVSEGFLKYYDAAGRLIRREKIRRDTYSARGGTVAVAPDDRKSDV